jgi:hypothetical protein
MSLPRFTPGMDPPVGIEKEAGWTSEARPVFIKLWSATVRRMFRKKKHCKKNVSDIERMKNIAMCVRVSLLKLHLLVDLRQKVGELVLSTIVCAPFIILENTLN